MRARGWCTLALCAAAVVVACVDGTTPDCSSPTSGCFPTDAGGQSDVAEASSDSSPPVDAASDAVSDAADAATDATTD